MGVGAAQPSPALPDYVVVLKWRAKGRQIGNSLFPRAGRASGRADMEYSMEQSSRERSYLEVVALTAEPKRDARISVANQAAHEKGSHLFFLTQLCRSSYRP